MGRNRIVYGPYINYKNQNPVITSSEMIKFIEDREEAVKDQIVMPKSRYRRSVCQWNHLYVKKTLNTTYIGYQRRVSEAKLTMEQVFGAVGLDASLSDDERNFLTVCDHLSDKNKKMVFSLLEDLANHWYDIESLNKSISPATRLYVLGNMRPQSIPGHFIEGTGAGLDRSEFTERELQIGTYLQNFISPIKNFDCIKTEELPALAKKMGVSLRWLCGYHQQYSFWGFPAEVEYLYDIWSIQSEKLKSWTYKLIMELQEKERGEFLNGGKYRT